MQSYEVGKLKIHILIEIIEYVPGSVVRLLPKPLLKRQKRTSKKSDRKKDGKGCQT